jgi:hypothetical protein
VATHPHTTSRELIRVLFFAPSKETADWIREELAKEQLELKPAATVAQVVTALIDEPPPRAQLLIVDLDAVAPGDLLHLHTVREQGWFGSMIALGNVPSTLRKSLNIERVIAPPYRKDSLRNAVMSSGISGPTTRIPKVDR